MHRFLLAAALLSAQSPESTLVQAIDADAPAAVELLERLVNQNSGTFNPAGVRAVAAIMERELVALGFETRLIPLDSIKRGVHLAATRKGPGKPILLIGHMDTVFEPSSPFQRWERKGRTATGPGVSDMKGGLVVMLSALKALHKSGQLDGIPLSIFLTGDEEAPGELSVTRREFIEAGKAARAALCFETGIRSVSQDMVSTARRGFTGWQLRTTGKAGHSGGIFNDQMGYGAVYEISRILNEFQQTLREPNMTFNVGMLLGGANPKSDPAGTGTVNGKDNIIPAEALAKGEIRALSPEQAARIKDGMYAIAAKNLPGTKAELTFEAGYPPMAPTAGNKRLLQLLNESSRAAGLPEAGELDPMLRGAGDISFIAPFVDSLSGLGAIGSGAHAVGESVDVESIPRQAKRAALLMRRLVQEPLHIVVYEQPGRFAGWPANHGLWSWGKEIVFGFDAAPFVFRQQGHAISHDHAPDQLLARSFDGGDTWSIDQPKSLELPAEVKYQNYPAGKGLALQDSPGNIDFTRKDFAFTARMTGNPGVSRFYYSYDRGRNWAGPFKLPDFGHKGTAARTDYIVNGKHDMFLFTTLGKANGKEGRVACTRTRDGGNTWTLEGLIGPEPADNDYAIMPASLLLGPQTLYTAIRRKGFIEAYRSIDDGKTWTAEGKIAPEIGAGNPPSLLKLRDGRLALIYGYRRPPFGIRARVSNDLGKTWSDEIILRTDGGTTDLGYPRSAERPDGKIVSAYYFNTDNSKVRFIGATIWQP